MLRSKMLCSGALAMLGLTGCSDANTYPSSLADTKERLANQQANYTSKGNIVYLSTEGAHGNSIMVTINSPSTYWRAECLIKLEEVDRENTRLVPECGTSGNEHKQKKYRAVEERIATQARVIMLGEEAAGEAN